MSQKRTMHAKMPLESVITYASQRIRKTSPNWLKQLKEIP